MRVITHPVSTLPVHQAIAHHADRPPGCEGEAPIRIFLFVVLTGLVAIVGGVLMMGAFPPQPHPVMIEKVLPNDKFGQHS